MRKFIFRCALPVVLATWQAMAAFQPTQRPFHAQHYKLKLQLDPSQDPSEFEAEVEARLEALTSLEDFSLDIDQLQIEKVELIHPSHAQASFTTPDASSVQIHLPHTMAPHKVFTVRITYRGKIRSAHAGFFKVTDPDEPDRGPLLFTHFEPLMARAFFPCDDQPFDKATTEISIRVPEHYEALSNGRRMADQRVHHAGHTWREIHWELDKPQSTYLVSLAVGPFSRVATRSRNTEISIWVGHDKTEKARYALDVTKRSLEFFENYLGVPYPWPKYDTIGVPTFLWGGMENTTSTHMNQERTLLYDPSSEMDKKMITLLASHELAHQWFGDDVTMKWWDDVWLNEAFASFMETEATGHIFGNEEALIDNVTGTWNAYFRQEDGPRSHPIVDQALDSPDDAFDSINYTKGENVLRMLSYYVGKETFQRGVRQYLEAHAYGNADYKDFFDAMEKASGKSLAAFRDSWLLQRGYPVLSYQGSWDAKVGSYHLELNQRSNHPADKTLFTFRVPVVFHRKTTPAYATSVDVEMNGAEQSVDVKLPDQPEWVTVNPKSWVLAKVVPGGPPGNIENVLANQALSDPDALSRIWASFTLAQGLLDDSPLSDRAKQTLLAVLREDSSPYVRNSLLELFGRIKSRWIPEPLGQGVLSLAREAQRADFAKGPLYLSDPHGWSIYRARVLGAVGRVKKDEAFDLLSERMARADLPLDDLAQASLAVARLGAPRSEAVLKAALDKHGPRGYRYRYAVMFAFGALESPAAAAEIREITRTCGSDLMGRIGWVVQDNQTLKSSSEWAGFLQDFLLRNDRFGDEVKARILQTVEQVKTPAVQTMLENVIKGSGSPRIKEVCSKILGKNFGKSA